jgi:hypothetical protein
VNENRIMKIVFKRKEGELRKNSRRGEFDQSTLYACMEISQ